MTYLELAQLLRSETSVSGGVLPVTVEAQVGMLGKLCYWVAEADFQIQLKWENWNFLWRRYSLDLDDDIVGDGYYSTPGLFGLWDRSSFSLQYGSVDSIPLTFTEYLHYRDKLASGELDNNDPQFVTMLPNRKLAVWPVPVIIPPVTDPVTPTEPTGLTLAADYWQSPNRLTNNTDISSIPERFHRIILVRAKMMYFDLVGHQGRWNIAAAEYTELLEELESAELPENRTRSNSQDVNMTMRAV